MAELVEQFNNLSVISSQKSDVNIKIKKTRAPKQKSDVKIKNKGTGAGGNNINIYGKKFEELTDNQSMLLQDGYSKVIIRKNSKYGYYLQKTIKPSDEIEVEIIFVLQTGLNTYCNKFFNINLFREPDEAYIIKHNNDITKKTTIKILEKKTQNGQGSVETKLWAAPSLKREYEIVFGDKFNVEYAFCLSTYLSNKLHSKTLKYNVLKQILSENNILVFDGNSENYHTTLNEWINNF